jgi:uncharacterized membrane protein YsdA (DUF1294 family)
LPLYPDLRLIIEWVGLVSLFGFAAMGIDKLSAVRRSSRISERALWLTALIGGFPGVFIGGYAFRHKTSKAEFWAPVIVSAILWTVAVALLTRSA